MMLSDKARPGDLLQDTVSPSDVVALADRTIPLPGSGLGGDPSVLQMSKTQRKRARVEYAADLAVQGAAGGEQSASGSGAAPRRILVLFQGQGGVHRRLRLWILLRWRRHRSRCPPCPDALVGQVHRDTITFVPEPRAGEELAELVCVARPVNKVERERAPAAMAAWRKAWARLRAIGSRGEPCECEQMSSEGLCKWRDASHRPGFQGLC